MPIPTIDLTQTGANIAALRKAAGLSVHDLQKIRQLPKAIYSEFP